MRACNPFPTDCNVTTQNTAYKKEKVTGKKESWERYINIHHRTIIGFRRRIVSCIHRKTPHFVSFVEIGA